MGARGIVGPVVALTGTPGTGKTAVSTRLSAQGFPVLELGRYAGDPRFDEGGDAARHGARVIDEAALSDFLVESLAGELGLAAGHGGPVFIDSHFAHELSVVDRILVLRCRPSVLAKRLEARGWPPAKVRENVEAEAIDVVLQESLAAAADARDAGAEVAVGEIDTSEIPPDEAALRAVRLATADPVNLQIGTVDWSGEVLGWF